MGMRQCLGVGVLVVLIFIGCQQEPEETTTKGTLHVRIPESIEPLITAEVQAFSELYKEHGANLSYSITTSETAVKEFLEDTLRLCFTTLPLTSEQKERAKEVSSDFTVTLFAYDAVVLMVNTANTLRQITTEDIRNILTGTITRWEQIPRSRKKGNLRVVLQDSADIAAYLRFYYRLDSLFIRNWVRVYSAREVLQTVAKEKDVLGFSSLSWLPSVPHTVTVLEVAASAQPADTLFAVAAEAIGKYYLPHAAYIYWRYYPLYRPLYVCCRSRGTLAAGFTAFVVHTEGQKIVRDKGLLPGTAKVVLQVPK